jgi:hypothetical protein
MHPRTEVIQSGKVRNLDVTESLTYQGTPFVPSAATDEKAKVSSNDTTPGFLNGKLVAGTNVTLTENNNGGDETLTISANFTDADDKSKVSANDTTAGFLNGKLVAGTNITLTENNNGGDETLTISFAGGGGGLTGFTGSQNSTGVNITVNASQLLADAASANADIVLSPKGTGAILAQLPDGTSAGGNKRNSNAVDLQTARDGANEVASGAWSVVAGGRANKATASYSVCAGGQQNTSSGGYSTVSGGQSNVARSNWSTIGGGTQNDIGAGKDYVTVSGGRLNTSYGAYSTIGGGYYNVVGDNNDYSAISGGRENEARGSYATVGGGWYNRSLSNYSVSAGGQNNTTSSNHATISGGLSNSITSGGSYSAISGGQNNSVTSASSHVGGGSSNTASGVGSVVAGGSTNTASGANSVVSGGNSNIASSANGYSVVSGGYGNQAIGASSTVIGGSGNFTTADLSVASGGDSHATKYGSRVHAAGKFSTLADNQEETVIVRTITTDGVIKQLTLNGGTPGTSNRIAIEANSTYSFHGLFVARRTDAANESAGYIIAGVIDNNAGTTAFVGTPTVQILGEDTPAWDIAAFADDINDALFFSVTGEASKTIRWAGTIRMMKVVN